MNIALQYGGSSTGSAGCSSGSSNGKERVIRLPSSGSLGDGHRRLTSSASDAHRSMSTEDVFLEEQEEEEEENAEDREVLIEEDEESDGETNSAETKLVK